jgi:hypothetical protein
MTAAPGDGRTLTGEAVYRARERIRQQNIERGERCCDGESEGLAAAARKP